MINRVSLNPKDYTRRLRCMDCGHEQEATPAHIRKHPSDPKRVVAMCGSAFDHCDKCDGPMEDIGPATKGE